MTSVQTIGCIGWAGIQPVEQRQLLEKHRLPVRRNMSASPGTHHHHICCLRLLSEDGFLWLRSGRKSGLLMVPAPSLSFTREGVKKASPPDPRQAAASYLWRCTEQMWSGHFQKRIWEMKISAALSQTKQTFARASTKPANGQSGLRSPQTSSEQGVLISSEMRTCRCTQPTLGCSEEKAMEPEKPL